MIKRVNKSITENFFKEYATEVFLCDNKTSMDAHRELFRLEAGKYLLCSFPPVNCILNLDDCAHKIHLALLWHGMLRVALWKSQITVSETIYILKETGLQDDDINPFKNSEIGDIFPALYYGKNFDILRRLCTFAKKVTEQKLLHEGIKVDCHLVAEDTGKIVASSM